MVDTLTCVRSKWFMVESWSLLTLKFYLLYFSQIFCRLIKNKLNLLNKSNSCSNKDRLKTWHKCNSAIEWHHLSINIDCPWDFIKNDKNWNCQNCTLRPLTGFSFGDIEYHIDYDIKIRGYFWEWMMYVFYCALKV